MAAHCLSACLGEEDSTKMQYSAVKYIVEEALPSGLLDELKELLLKEPKIAKLWGSQQVTGFAHKMITLSLYKDLSGLGYDKLLSSIDFGFHINSKSMQHNVKLI